jgi:hypothetical protein
MTGLSTHRRKPDIHLIRQEAANTMASEQSHTHAIRAHSHWRQQAQNVHVAAIMDPVGGTLDTLTLTTDAAGFLGWADSFGKLIAFDIEGTGSYGAGLTSFIRRQVHKVVEVTRKAASASSAHKAGYRAT